MIASPLPLLLVIAIQVAAVAFNVWARASFKSGTFRVTAGAGAGYLAALVFIWAGVVSHLSALTLVIGIAVTVVCVARVIAEERLLREKHTEYADYSRSTKALIPFLY